MTDTTKGKWEEEFDNFAFDLTRIGGLYSKKDPTQMFQDPHKTIKSFIRKAIHEAEVRGGEAVFAALNEIPPMGDDSAVNGWLDAACAADQALSRIKESGK